jgi:hypothetical protein
MLILSTLVTCLPFSVCRSRNWTGHAGKPCRTSLTLHIHSSLVTSCLRSITIPVGGGQVDGGQGDISPQSQDYVLPYGAAEADPCSSAHQAGADGLTRGLGCYVRDVVLPGETHIER